MREIKFENIAKGNIWNRTIARDACLQNRCSPKKESYSEYISALPVCLSADQQYFSGAFQSDRHDRFFIRE